MQSQRGEPIAKGIKTPYKGIRDYRGEDCVDVGCEKRGK